jgi:hypothetical protein
MVDTDTRLEYAKILFEYLRHLATLSTGSILLIAAFLEKVFPQRAWTAMAIIALFGFIISVVGTVIAYTLYLPSVHSNQPMSETKKNIFGWGLVLAWGGFLLGIICLTVFAIKNLLTF